MKEVAEYLHKEYLYKFTDNVSDARVIIKLFIHSTTVAICDDSFFSLWIALSEMGKKSKYLDRFILKKKAAVDTLLLFPVFARNFMYKRRSKITKLCRS